MAEIIKRKHYSNCCVFGCLNSSINSELTFFSLPVDEDRRENWLRLISREDLIDRPATHHTVCEDHFDTMDIIQGQVRKILKKKAVPTLKIRLKEDAATQTNRAILIENYTQTHRWPVVVSKGVQTMNKYDVKAKRKRKIEPQAEVDPLLECKQETEASEKPQKEMFHKLCDKFLTKKLAKLVKAQTD